MLRRARLSDLYSLQTFKFCVSFSFELDTCKSIFAFYLDFATERNPPREGTVTIKQQTKKASGGTRVQHPRKEKKKIEPAIFHR